MQMIKGKRGMQQIEALVWSLVMVGIFLGIGLLLLGKFHTQIVTEDATAAAAINETITAVADIPGWLPIVVIIVIASVILFYVFVMRRQQGN